MNMDDRSHFVCCFIFEGVVAHSTTISKPSAGLSFSRRTSELSCECSFPMLNSSQHFLYSFNGISHPDLLCLCHGSWLSISCFIIALYQFGSSKSPWPVAPGEFVREKNATVYLPPNNTSLILSFPRNLSPERFTFPRGFVSTVCVMLHMK